MNKEKAQLVSPLFLKYQNDFEKNPRGLVFAPLAEIYRKLGMTEKAMEILSQGIRLHPTYLMGHLGLAFCYFDLKQYTLTYSTLKPFVEISRDNLRLQKLFAATCLELHYDEEALETYKYLLFINSRDKEVALHVSRLEQSIENQYKVVHKPIHIPESEFLEQKELKPYENKRDFDDWMALDLSRKARNDKSEEALLENYDFWSLKKETTITKVQLDLDSESNFTPETPQDFLKNDKPMVTHTLVDLYCGQGHIEKALDVLEKILILNPEDEKTLKKISEIKKLMGDYKIESPPPRLEIVQENSEEDGRKNLMNAFDQKVNYLKFEDKKEIKKEQIEKKLSLFLKKIQKRALDYQARTC